MTERDTHKDLKTTTPAAPWRRVFRSPAPRLEVFERFDRGGPAGRLYIRWWARRPGRRGNWKKRSLGFGLRDQSGAIVPELEMRALSEAAELHQQLVAGRDPAPGANSATGIHLEAALEEYLAVGSGRFAVDTPHRRDMIRAARVLIDVLGAHTPVAALDVDCGQRVWRSMAHASAAGAGRRWAERVVGDLLYPLGRWCEERNRIPTGAAARPTRWRRRLRDDWTRISELGAGAETAASDGQRYSVDELRRLLAALPGSDPRFQWLILAGLELRAGQLVRVRRSDLDLGPVGAYGLGRLRVAGHGSKLGAVIDLDCEMRARIDHEMNHGYLANLERAFIDDDMDDYALFPGGRLVRDRVPLTAAATRHATRATLHRWLVSLEMTAGVSHQPGRALHGLRRASASLASDLASEVGAESREVLDAVGGWAPGSPVRERLYVERERESVLERAAHIRTAIRQHLMEGVDGSLSAPPHVPLGRAPRGTASAPGLAPPPAPAGVAENSEGERRVGRWAKRPGVRKAASPALARVSKGLGRENEGASAASE